MKTVRNSIARRDKPWITNGLKNACQKKIDYINYFFVLDRVPLKENTKLTKTN